MRVVRREFFGITRSDEFRIIPIGDVHIGNVACNEKLLASVVERVASEANTYWLDMGDKCEFINLKDPRFDIGSLAEWIKVSDMVDLTQAQLTRYLDFVSPIAHKLLAMVKGNHEFSIQKYFERNIHLEAVTTLKKLANHPPDYALDLDTYGWIQLAFYRHETKRNNATTININVHHGVVDSRLAGAKALNMQRWLWNHECDIALMGHAHNTSIQREGVETIDRGGNVKTVRRVGCFTGTFMESVQGSITYAERRGYFPLPIDGIEIVLRPGAIDERDRIRVVT